MPYEKFMLEVRLQANSEREQFIYRIPVTHARLEGKSHCAYSVMCREKLAPDRKSCEEMHFNVLQKI
jgi:hypothetical protein